MSFDNLELLNIYVEWYASIFNSEGSFESGNSTLNVRNRVQGHDRGKVGMERWQAGHEATQDVS